MCLTETWIQSSEHELIQNIINDRMRAKTNQCLKRTKTAQAGLSTE